MPRLQNLAVEWVSLVDRAAVRDPSNPTEPQRLLLWKSESGAPNTPDRGGTMSDAEPSAALKKAETERDELVDKVEKLEASLAEAVKKAEAEKPEPEQINKDELSPAVRDRLEKLEKAEQESAERLAKAEEIAKAERDQRITREFVAKAEDSFALVGGDPAEFGPLLKSASEKLSKEEYEALETRLRAANEQVSKSNLFKEAGIGGDPKPGSDADLETLQRKAEELRKSDSSLTPYDAMRLAMVSNPEAQAAYLASVR